ncbi:outer membrane efflux family protein, partial [Vibrio parahaemolyticus EKP-021]
RLKITCLIAKRCLRVLSDNRHKD